jgi:hypothetical protein
LGTQQRILRFAIRSNWILFVVASMLGFAIASHNFTMGIIFGGLIATINFHLLYMTLRKTFTPKGRPSLGIVLAKYYVRFIVSGFIIFILISGNVVDPIGLCIGLSVVVASMTLATMLELTKLIFKEAA